MTETYTTRGSAWSVLIAASTVALVACGPTDSWSAPLPGDIDLVDGSVAQLIRSAVEDVDAHPEDAQRVYRLGRIYDANDIQEPARECYLRSVALDTELAPGWYGLGRKLFEEGRSLEALDAFRRVSAIDPDYAPAYTRTGTILFEEGRLDEAQAAYEAAMGKSARGTAAPVGLARVFAQKEQHEQAVSLLRTALEREPRDGQAHYLMGMSLRALGESEQAAVHLALGQAQGGGNEPDPWVEDGMQYRLSPRAMLDDADSMHVAGYLDLSAAHLERLVKREPEHLEALNNLAIVYMDLGRMEDAQAMLERAARTHPGSFATELNIASFYTRAGDPAQALQHAERATKLAPDNAQTWFSKGLALSMQERWEAALEAMKRSYALDPNNLASLGGLAELSVRLNRLTDAVRYFELAIQRDAASARFRHDLAFAYLKLGRLDQAERRAREALQLDPDNDGARRLLQNVEKARGGGR